MRSGRISTHVNSQCISKDIVIGGIGWVQYNPAGSIPDQPLALCGDDGTGPWRTGDAFQLMAVISDYSILFWIFFMLF